MCTELLENHISHKISKKDLLNKALTTDFGKY